MTMTTEEPTWQMRGACRNQNPEIYWPVNDPLKPPVDVRCWICPVAKECLEWALKNEDEGVWGGTTARQRRSLNRVRPKVTCVGCSSDDILEMRGGEVCLGCGLSWPV